MVDVSAEDFLYDRCRESMTLCQSQQPLANSEVVLDRRRVAESRCGRSFTVEKHPSMRIVVGDRDVRVRSALKALLREEDGVTLVGESSDLPSLVIQIKELKPDVVLLDWELPGRPAAALLLAQARLHRPPKVIVLSARSESERESLAVGADAFVSKGDAPEALLAAFRTLIQESGKKTATEEAATRD
jgi:DNA-binding response OmpR family regulator